MAEYWLRNFETWGEYVDQLVVCVNGPDTAEAQALYEKAGAKVISFPDRLGHDGAINALLDATDAEYIVLCEDDAYVRKPEAVDLAFRQIDSGVVDIVGSPRHEDYASSPLQHWPDDVNDSPTELRRGFWPAFLFARRNDLLSTNRYFGDTRWNVGERIAGWRTVTMEDCLFVGISPDFVHLDTFFGTTMQLRAKGLRIDLVHHVRLFDAAAADQWLAEDPPWFHVTGLSTLDEALSGRTDLPDLDEHGGLWTRRLAWWYEVTMDSRLPGKAKRFRDLMDFQRRAGIRPTDVDEWWVRFEPWITWSLAVPA
jgi:glycosyltransferase involved in cell wall biosynthesis